MRLPKEAMWTDSALRQASRARVPLVVVMMISRPATRSRVNSRGELPRSKSTPPVKWALMRNPSRSPASNASGWPVRSASASAISRAGKMPVAPLPKASSMVEVALRTSKTTHVTPRRSFAATASYSDGENSTRSDGVGRAAAKEGWLTVGRSSGGPWRCARRGFRDSGRCCLCTGPRR